tara:strand:+ start:6279 stop:7367 length:1089 start_codon:yes stop_codon:yes gene_type:complete
MKVCLFLPGLNNGGAERVFLSLNKYFDELGVRSEILCATRKGLLFKYINTSKIKCLNSSYAILSFFRFKKYIDDQRPDIIIASLTTSIIILGFFKKIFYLRNAITVARIANIFTRPRSWREKIVLIVISSIINSFDLIICNSEHTKKSLKLLNYKNFNKVKVIYNPVIKENFNEIKRLNINSSKRPLILTIGRLVEQKRIDHVIKAFAETRKKLGKGHLVIIGDGILKKRLTNLVRNLELYKQVAFIPYFNKIPELLKSADCFINASQYEGFGNIFIESLAYCKNTLVYESPGGARELLKNTSAYLIPNGRNDLLAKKLYEIVVNNSDNYSRDAEFLNNFRKDHIAKKYYNEILKIYEKNNI